MGGGGSRPKETRVLIRKLKALGCEVIPYKGHWKVYRDGHYIATLPGSPSDWRSMANTTSQLKRRGLEV